MTKQQKADFDRWWNDEGSAPPDKSRDHAEHARHLAEIAWSNGGYKARVEAELKIQRLTFALKDAISTYSPDRETVLVTAERQEAWAAALKSSQ